MNCQISCYIVIVLTTAMLYLKLFSNKNNIVSAFEKSLPSELQSKYQQLAEERKNIHIKGMIYGLVLAFILLFLLKNIKNRVCFVLAIMLIFSHLYYILVPKSDYIILYLNDYHDRNRWLAVYKHMQNNYYFGIIIGLIIVMIGNVINKW